MFDASRKTQLAPVSSAAAISRLNAFAPAIMADDQPIQLQYPPAEIASLLGAIQNTLMDRVCPVVQFVSAYRGEGSSGIAFEVALASARQTGKRTLFINLNSAPEKSYAALSAKVQISLEAFFRTEQPQSSPLASLQGVPLFYTEFCQPGGDLASSLNVSFARSLFSDLREHFDMVVVSSEGAMTGAYPAALGGMSDGSIMVVEAERTRAPVIEELKQQIETAGGRVIGAVLNRRRFYIPRLIYRLLFGRR